MHMRVCPLYSFDQAGKPHMVGSSIPFASENGAFLITAAHVCFTPHRQPVPLFTWADTGPIALREFRIAWDHQQGRTLDADVALIALSDDDTTTLRRSYCFSDSDSVSTTKHKAPGVHYLIAGYPFSRNRITTTDLSPPALATHLITGHIESVRVANTRDKADDHHFALAFPRTPITTVNGRTFRIPKPQGMSGGGIWRLDINTATRMASTPQLVGVGIEYHVTKKARAFIGTRVQLALSLAPDLHSHMRSIVRSTTEDQA